MNVRYRAELDEGERQSLTRLVAGGSRRVRQIKRAQILLAADQGCADEAIARTVQVGTSTVYRTKRRFVEESLAAALSEAPQPGGRRKLSTSDEALLVAVACSTPPRGASDVDLGPPGRRDGAIDRPPAALPAHHRPTVSGKRAETVATQDVVCGED